MLRLVYDADRDLAPHSRAQPETAAGRHVLAYWRGLNGGLVPERMAIDPVRLFGYLPCIAMFEKVATLGWRCRVSGSQLTLAGVHGGDLMDAALGLEARRCAELAAVRRAPWLMQGAGVEVLFLPLRSYSLVFEPDRMMVLAAPTGVIPDKIGYVSDRSLA